MNTIQFKNWTCFIEKCEYGNGRPALLLRDIEDNSPVIKPTTNLPDFNLFPGHVLIKNYSENEGILETLAANKIIEPPRSYVETEYDKLYICKLLI